MTPTASATRSKTLADLKGNWIWRYSSIAPIATTPNSIERKLGLTVPILIKDAMAPKAMACWILSSGGGQPMETAASGSWPKIKIEAMMAAASDKDSRRSVRENGFLKWLVAMSLKADAGLVVRGADELHAALL